MRKHMFAVWVFVVAFVCHASLFAAEAAAEVTEAAAGGWGPLVAKIGVLAVEVLTPILMLLGSWAAYKLAKRFGIDLSDKQKTMVKGYVKEAINATERWAKNEADKPTSKDKLAKAVDYANKFMTDSGLKAKSSEYLVGLIEAQLEWDENKDK